MQFNGRKYDKALSEIIRKVSNAAPLFQSQIEEVDEKTSHYNDLVKEEKKLIQQKDVELEAQHSGGEICRSTTEYFNEQYELHRQIVANLKQVAEREAALAIANGKEPCIMGLKVFEGRKTELIKNARLKVRLLKIKTRIKKKLDRLHELQSNVYCLDLDEDNSYQLGDIVPAQTEKSSSEQVARYVKESLHLTTQRLPLPSISNLSKVLHLKIDQSNPIQTKSQFNSNKGNLADSTSSVAEIPLDVLRFRKTNQKHEKDVDIKNLSVLERPKIFNSEETEQIYSIFSEIDTLYRERQEFLDNFYKENEFYKFEGPTALFSCVNLLVNSSSVLCKTQEILNNLNDAIIRNTSIPFDIWTNENHIRLKMARLLSSIDRLTDRLSKCQKFVKIGQIGYTNDDDDEPIVVEEISTTQIRQCNSLISDLHEEFAKAERENYETLEKIKEAVDTFSKIKSNEEKEKLKLEKINSETVNEQHQTYLEDFNFPELVQLKAELLEKQNAELSELFELINAIPDDLKNIDFDENDFQKSPLPSIQLPAVSNFEEVDSSTNAIQEENDELMESNQKLIEQIKAKSFRLETPIYPKSKNEAKPNVFYSSKPKRNENLETLVENWNSKLRSSVSIDQTVSLIEKRRSLTEQLADLQYRVESAYEKKKERLGKKLEIQNELKLKEEKLKVYEEETKKLQKKLKNSPFVKKKIESRLNELDKSQRDLKMQIRTKSVNQKKYNELSEELESVTKEFNEIDLMAGE